MISCVAPGAAPRAPLEGIQGRGRSAGTLQHLKKVGKWGLGIAEKVGVSLVVEVIKRATQRQLPGA